MKKQSRNLKSQRSQSRQLSAVERNKRELVTWAKRHDDILLYLEALLADFNNLLPSYGAADYTKDLDTLRRRFRAEGASFATRTLPTLMDGLLAYLERGVSDYPGFKTVPGGDHPAFLQQLFAPIYSATSDEAERTVCIKLIYQFSVSFKKIKGPYPLNVLSKQLDDFVEVDKEIGNIKLFRDSNLPILRHARAIITRLFKDVDIEESMHARPRPGPGATNTPVEKHMRYEPHVLYTQIDDVLPYDTWFYNSPWHTVVKAQDYLKLVKDKVHSPRSRFRFVDKQVGKARGICIEENETQWFQQAFKNLMYETLEKHPETRGKVNFASQDVNRKLALSSSRTLSMATIDMKEASDRIPRDLVGYLFSNLPELREVLLALSTRYIDFPKEICGDKDFIEVQKYAPMGSGLCFPVMAVVHYALITAIILETAIQNRYRLSKKVYVYGDDIILPTQCVQAIYDWLPQFGMKLNELKSYYTSHFRESCGLHAYNGEEITPVYFRSIPTQHSRTDGLLSAIGTEYGLYSRGLLLTSQLLRQRTESRFGPLPLIGRLSGIAVSDRMIQKFGSTLNFDQSGAAPLGWIREGRTRKEHIINYAHRVKRNADYQASTYRLRVVRALTESLPPMPEDEGYLRMLTTQIRQDSSILDAATIPELRSASASVEGSCKRLYVTYGWVQESAL